MDDQIHVTNPDGTEEVFRTNWQEVRLAVELEEKRRLLEARAAVHQNQTEKREKAPKKRSGRGC